MKQGMTRLIVHTTDARLAWRADWNTVPLPGHDDKRASETTNKELRRE